MPIPTRVAWSGLKSSTSSLSQLLRLEKSNVEKGLQRRDSAGAEPFPLQPPRVTTSSSFETLLRCLTSQRITVAGALAIVSAPLWGNGSSNIPQDAGNFVILTLTLSKPNAVLWQLLASSTWWMRASAALYPEMISSSGSPSWPSTLVDLNMLFSRIPSKCGVGSILIGSAWRRKSVESQRIFSSMALPSLDNPFTGYGNNALPSETFVIETPTTSFTIGCTHQEPL
jgi:hypothetical protein